MGELRSASVTLAEIISYIKQTRQTGRLSIRILTPEAAPQAPAVLLFDSGHLVDARQNGESGDDLVYRLLANREATYSFDRLSAEKLPPGRSITRVQELLMLAASGILSEDETGRAGPAPVPARPSTAPGRAPASPADGIAREGAAWPAGRVAAELRRTAEEVLGAKARPVLELLITAGSEPRAIQAACTRAKQVTRVFIGPEKHAELSRRIDGVLVHLQ